MDINKCETHYSYKKKPEHSQFCHFRERKTERRAARRLGVFFPSIMLRRFARVFTHKRRGRNSAYESVWMTREERNRNIRSSGRNKEKRELGCRVRKESRDGN